MTEQIRLSDACEQFLTWRKTNLADETWRSYRSALGLFLQVTGDVMVSGLRPDHIERFLAERRRPHVDRRGRSMPPIGPAGYNQYLGALGVFSKWLLRHAMVSVDLTAGIERIRARRPIKRRLDPEQIIALLDAAPARDRMLFSLAFFAALRATEATSLRIGDVDLASNTLRVQVWKTHQEDDFPIGPELRAQLDAWLPFYEASVRRSWSRDLEPADFLVPALTPHRYSWQVVDGVKSRDAWIQTFEPGRPVRMPYQLVKRALKRIGLSAEGEGMHILRRSAARIMFDKLIEESKYENALRIVMAALHHTTSSTTEQYIGLTTEQRSRDQFLRTTPLLADALTPGVINAVLSS
ncbi:hypothetical protein EFL95_09020 [Nocardioides marmorisolisilvae]|uniref:Site-specific integrase n=2 Tax=Nocardioides marmorisolisilvae TaxID=1542737 RepID=A0A3N0DU80_9ACTN|nr:hypothetical protein EFL95_09020 [Nocardioides marmorisolisilvae]